MEGYEVKSVGSALGGAVSTKERTLIETLGSAVEKAGHIDTAVARISARLLSGAEQAQSAECPPPPLCNAQMDAERIRRTLSSIESTLEYLESRLG